MSTLHPRRPLSIHLKRALETAQVAQHQHRALRIRNVARLARTFFPQATTITVKARRRNQTPRLLLHAVDGSGQRLWSADSPKSEELREYQTDDGYGWDEVVAQIETDLTTMIGPDQPEQLWTRHGNRSSKLFVIGLAGPEHVAESERIAPGHLAAHLRDTNTVHSEMWLASPVRYPTMTVGNLNITAYINAKNGTLTVDIDTDDLPATAQEGQIELDVLLNGLSLLPQPKAGS